MFGLWFSIVGLIFGTLCSFTAKAKNRVQEDWFTLGFIFSFLALGILYILPEKTDSQKEEKFEIGTREQNISLFVID